MKRSHSERLSLSLAGATATLLAPSLAAAAQIDAALIAAQGLTAPGSGAATISNVNAPFTNGYGKVGFTGNLSDGDWFVWFGSGIVWKNSDDGVNVLTGTEGTMGIGDNGEFIYSPSINGLDGVYTNNGPLLKDDDPAPGFPGMFNVFDSRPTMKPNGTSYWMAGITATLGGGSTNRCFYRCTDSVTPVIEVVFAGGDVIDGFTLTTTASNFTYDVSNNGLHHIHEVQTTAVAANDMLVYVDGQMLHQEGTPTGAGGNWGAVGTMGINDSGNYVFSADTTEVTTMDEVVAYNGAVVMRESGTYDGVTLATGATVRAVSINNRNQIACIWGWGSGATLNELLYVGDAADMSGTARLMLRVGDTIDIDGDNVDDYQVFDFEASATISPGLDLAENGYIYVEVGLGPVGGAETTNAIIRLAGIGLKGDVNCDGVIDFFDIDPFLLALFDPAAYALAFPNCDILNADTDSSGGVDFFDIDPFLAILFP